jgi:hypothetical protein
MLQAHQLSFVFIVALCWLQAVTAANETALNDTGLNAAFCNSNTSIGFHPHPTDCSKYYYCAQCPYYCYPVIFQCPYDYHWDVKAQRCSCPTIAQCSCESENSTTPPPHPTWPPRPPTPSPYNPCRGAEFYPCPWDCTKFFHCDGAIAYLMDCPAHLEWDTKANRCEWPIIAQCSTGPTHRPPPLTTPAPLPPYTDTPYNPCNGAEFYPCPWDCTKFFHCDGAIAYLKDCPSNLEWDTKTNRCQWPRIAQCSTDPTHRPPLTTPAPPPYTDTPYNPCNGAEFYPCPWDCTKFFHCDGTIAYLKDCPSNLEWDTKTNRCQWPRIAQCSTDPTHRPPLTTPAPAPYTDTPFNPCHGAEFYPCPWDCTKFFHCDGTIAYLKDCPSHLQWDTKTNRCEWPFIARCKSGRQSTT